MTTKIIKLLMQVFSCKTNLVFSILLKKLNKSYFLILRLKLLKLAFSARGLFVLTSLLEILENLVSKFDNKANLKSFVF